MSKRVQRIVAIIILILCFVGCLTICSDTHVEEGAKEAVEIQAEAVSLASVEPNTENELVGEGEQEEIVVTPDDVDMEVYWDSLEYVAMCVEAEAGNQDELGKRYVTDCILNRYDLGGYNNFFEVINDIGQFSCVSNGSIECIPSDETYRVVAEEIENRTNAEITYFRTVDYHDFATDCFQWGDHYFSK